MAISIIKIAQTETVLAFQRTNQKIKAYKWRKIHKNNYNKNKAKKGLVVLNHFRALKIKINTKTRPLKTLERIKNLKVK